MGVVYEAIDEDLDRRVAVKLVRPTASSNRRRGRLLREAQAIARVAHPNVIVVYEVGAINDEIYVAMELVEGPTLSEWLAATDRSWDEVIHVFLQAGRGIKAAHEIGLIHRDFKPANVLLGTDGRVRVADFGVVAVAPELSREQLPRQLRTSMTHTGALVGTPSYMAPELLEGGEADALSDQFSFCVALYQALYRERPFAGDNVDQLLNNIESGQLHPPPRGHGVPAWIHAIVVRGLGARAQRWPSMDALLSALDPERRRRRRRLAALAMALVLLTCVAGSAWARLVTTRCQTSDALAGIWDSSIRADLRSTLLELTSPEHTAAVTSRIDTYARSLLAVREQACKATRVHGEQSEALMDARMRCLDHRARELGALVEVLGDADEDVVDRAVSAVAALPAVERCSDPDYVNATLPPPDDPTTAIEVEALGESLARVRALDRAGRLGEARRQLDSLLELAARLDYRPLDAELNLVHGILLDDLGDGKAAAERLEQAYLDAHACGDDEIAQQAASRLVHVLGFRLMQSEPAQMWARFAEAELDFTNDELSRVHLALSRGEVHEAAGEPEAALGLYLEAQQLHDALPHPDPLLRAEILDDIGVVQIELSQYDEARTTLSRAYQYWTAELGDDHPLVARGISSLGVLHARTGHYAEAARAWETALGIWSTTKGAESDDVAAMHSNLGVVYRLLGDHEAAHHHLERALELRERLLGPDHPRVAGVHGNLGNLATAREDYAGALAAFTRALEISEAEFGPDDIRLASMLAGIGQAAVELGEARKALQVLERALDLQERHLAPGHNKTTETRMRIATAQLALGDTRAARKQLDLGLAEIAERPPSEAGQCRTGLTHARVLEAEGDRQAARAQAMTAIEQCKVHDPENRRALERLEQWLERPP